MAKELKCMKCGRLLTEETKRFSVDGDPICHGCWNQEEDDLNRGDITRR